MDQRSIKNMLTFIRMDLAEILFLFLFGLRLSCSQSIDDDSTMIARLDVDSLNLGSNIGYVELSVDGVNWYKVCDSSTNNIKFASVVCRQLGYGPPVVAEGHDADVDYSEVYFQYNDEWCNGNYSKVLDGCSLSGSTSGFSSGCYNHIILVECLPITAEVTEYEVALVKDSRSSIEGLVLIHINGRWGPVCEGNAGDAVCHQLGLPNDSGQGGVSGIYSYYPPVLDYLYCYNSKQDVEDCPKTRTSTYGHYTCHPDVFMKVQCCGEKDLEPHVPKDDGGLGYLGISVILLTAIGGMFIVCLAGVKAKQGQQNDSRITGYTLGSSSGNQQPNTPPRFGTTDCPLHQTCSSALQVRLPSSTQETDNAPPPYPATGYQSPTTRQLPDSPPNDPDLPSYADAMRSQRTT